MFHQKAAVEEYFIIDLRMASISIPKYVNAVQFSL